MSCNAAVHTFPGAAVWAIPCAKGSLLRVCRLEIPMQTVQLHVTAYKPCTDRISCRTTMLAYNIACSCSTPFVCIPSSGFAAVYTQLLHAWQRGLIITTDQLLLLGTAGCTGIVVHPLCMHTQLGPRRPAVLADRSMSAPALISSAPQEMPVQLYPHPCVRVQHSAGSGVGCRAVDGGAQSNTTGTTCMCRKICAELRPAYPNTKPQKPKTQTYCM
jgi:hypothetical protein